MVSITRNLFFFKQMGASKKSIEGGVTRYTKVSRGDISPHINIAFLIAFFRDTVLLHVKINTKENSIIFWFFLKDD